LCLELYVEALLAVGLDLLVELCQLVEDLVLVLVVYAREVGDCVAAMLAYD
jgi:hypothetical protein